MTKTLIQLSASLFLCVSCLSASVMYSVQVNTTALNGTAGNLDFQFNPGNVDAQSATAMVSGFSTTGVIGTPAQLSGDVTPANASLPGAFTLGNTAQFNDLFQPITFGTSLNFLVTLGGAAVNAPNNTSTSGSLFAFSLYDAAGINPLLTNSPDGAVLDIGVNPKAAIVVTAFQDANGNPPVAAPTLVPEPGSMVLLAIGIIGAFCSRSLKQRTPRR